jgi:cytidyltransferase-like protein
MRFAFKQSSTVYLLPVSCYTVDMKKIGLLFGSFNPLHNGHTMLAEAATKDIGLNEVWFVMQKENRYKPSFNFLSYEKRKELVSQSGLKLYQPQSTDYAHLILDTLREINDHEITLILGEDLVESFPRWPDYDQIRDLATIYESHRIDGISSGKIRDRLEAGESISDLVPPTVASYLAQHQH